MPPQAGRSGVWENAGFLMQLSMALYDVANKSGALSAEAKGAVEAHLKNQGYNQSWESVRTALVVLC
ncbi:hypothetical protein NQ176_g7959 [Zarea fungicola]|uniref:Uncharacterized protein n=1 Tax=Zarea fungicola TaxID=93591 RepID=A0ACC1MW78_9HYPO|nr:hypothetical protein NQ176_g7959 [Lecanicillium fungicola]